MKRTPWVLWLGLVAVAAFAFMIAACADDRNEDDEDDTSAIGAPLIPHGKELVDCLLCHADAHDGIFKASYTIPDTCLECHKYAEDVGDDDDTGDDDTGDDDTGDDDTGDDDDSSPPNIPSWHDLDGANHDCLTCHTDQHGGAYNDDTIPDKCLECHSQ